MFEIQDNGAVMCSSQTDSWELFDDIQQMPRRTDKSVGELLAESNRAWSKYE